MPRPLNERHFFEQELAEIPGQVAAYRQGLENGRATKARRERLEQIREREKRGWQKGKATGSAFCEAFVAASSLSTACL